MKSAQMLVAVGLIMGFVTLAAFQIYKFSIYEKNERQSSVVLSAAGSISELCSQNIEALVRYNKDQVSEETPVTKIMWGPKAAEYFNKMDPDEAEKSTEGCVLTETRAKSHTRCSQYSFSNPMDKSNHTVAHQCLEEIYPNDEIDLSRTAVLQE